METVNIDIDVEVFDKLKEIAIPFVDVTPNLVIRRLIGLSTRRIGDRVCLRSSSGSSPTVNRGKKKIITIVPHKDAPYDSAPIERLRSTSDLSTHQAFLTFLMDKFYNTHGNYKTSGIIPFLEKFNLRTPSGAYRNPWMQAPYGGEKNGRNSCTRTIEHFKQSRRFGCWGGKNIKTNCDAKDSCIYHPDNLADITNKCDLRKGVIWKRATKASPFVYGTHYVDVIKRELLNDGAMPLKPLLSVFYPNRPFNKDLANTFIAEFHFDEREMELFSYDFNS